MLDPLLVRIIALGFALLFIAAAIHKFSNRLQFAAQLEAYEILPVQLLKICSLAIPLIEIFLGIGWLLAGLSGTDASIIALVSALLLGLYTAGIAINLLKGRAHIDCGCGLATVIAGVQQKRSAQNLSYWLVLRNIGLIAAAAAATLPVTTRSFIYVDYFNLAAAVLSSLFLYGAYNQLMTNNNLIKARRNPHG